jgi:transposase
MTQMPKQQRTFNRDFKIMVCQLAIDKKLPVAEIARIHNLHAVLVYRWISEYEDHGSTAFVGKGYTKPEHAKDQEIRKLLKENERLRIENEILKKTELYLANERNANCKSPPKPAGNTR